MPGGLPAATPPRGAGPAPPPLPIAEEGLCASMSKMRPRSPTCPSSIGVRPRGPSVSSIWSWGIIAANRVAGMRPHVRNVIVFAPAAATTASTKSASISKNPKTSVIVSNAESSAGDGSKAIAKAENGKETSTTGVRS